MFFMLDESVGMQEFCILLTDEPSGGRDIPITAFLSPTIVQKSPFKEGKWSVFKSIF